MSKEWTQHRFSGGSLALDLVNTVIHRSDPARRRDRLTCAAAANSFASAAEIFRADELGTEFTFAPACESEFMKLLDLRARICENFVSAADVPEARLSALAGLLGASERALADSGPDSLLCQTVLSWMRVNDATKRKKMRACPNCGWLFLDRSRNGSRIWCDMAVCGNRQKARLNYQKRRHDAGKIGKAA